jgi:molybdopterin converting factor small subunit
LVWPFTSNARRKNGKKIIQVETDVKKTTRETKEQMGRLHKEWHKNLKIKNWTNCIQDHKNWKLYVEKAKTFKEMKL